MSTLPALRLRRPSWLDPRVARTEFLAGLVTALALIPEVISFSILAGVDPRVGLFTSFTMAVVIAFTGGRPAMVSAAAGAVALVVAPLVAEHGVQHLIAAVVLGGVLQILLAAAGIARLMRFIPRSVMVGFVNALAILIFSAQLPHLIGVPWLVLPLVAAGLAIIVLFPRLSTAVPAPLVAIVVLTVVTVAAGLDAAGSVAYMSPAVQSLLGRPSADYVGRDAISLADLRDQPRLLAAVAAAGRSGDRESGVVDTDIRVQHSSGGTRWVEMRISGRVDAVGIEGWVVNFREVTDRKLFEDELRRQARTDPLTGLLNRTAFNERLAVATTEVDAVAPPAVLFVDVDDFKTVNDTLGHAAGDELLVAVAARLSAAVRGDDVVARLGGDEFALLLTGADAERLRDVADRLLAGLRAPLQIAGESVTVTASIGGALAEPGCTAERLLHRADTAMYTAKRTGKDGRALLDATECVLS